MIIFVRSPQTILDNPNSDLKSLNNFRLLPPSLPLPRDSLGEPRFEVREQF